MKSFILLMVFGFCTSAAAVPLGPAKDHCVQYHARKTMFLFKSEDVWGSNCNVTADFQKEGSLAQLKLTIPVEKFDSGNSRRDEDVKNMLKYAEHPMMTFTMDRMEIEDLKKIIASNEESLIPGTLKIGGVAHPVKFKVRSQRDGAGGKFWILGKMETTFSHFQMEPPKVGGGLIAKTDDWLELEVSLGSNEVKGWESQ
ncbi:MAG: YceI family protein [Bdellovibrionales bacterium]|nr:YceI family protein [Bdellovibrionales bacterium]